MGGGFGGHMFEMADANRDGRVSLQEAQAAALQHFDMVDTNRDGRISPEERMQMRQRMQATRQHG
jgi:Ca2+-binding EF-hand superfamily protein